MLTPDATLTADICDYLEYEAMRRGTDIWTFYQEEMEAKAELARITPTNVELLRMADASPESQKWYDE